MEEGDWAVNITETDKAGDSISTEEVYANTKEEQTNETLSSKHFNSSLPDVKAVQCLPPLVVHKRTWPSPLPVSRNCQTFQRTRRKSFAVPEIVVTPDIGSDDEEPPRKANTAPLSSPQCKHLRMRLPRIEDERRLAPPVFDSSPRATYQPRFNRRNAYARLPKLSLNKMENQKE